MKIDYSLNIVKEKSFHEPRLEFVEPLQDSTYKIFEVKAGNGYGKTFLLNLIAYSVFGDRLGEKDLLPSIQSSLERYNDADYYNLNYDIELPLPDSKTMRMVKEIDGGRKVYLNDEKVDFEELYNEFSIVYDVPVDPSERLNRVIDDIGKWNSNLLEKIKSYYKIISEITDGFDEVRDSDKISQLEVEIESLCQYRKSIKENIGRQKLINESLESYKKLSSLRKSIESVDQLEIRVGELALETKKLKPKGRLVKSDASSLRLKRSELVSLNQEYESFRSEFNLQLDKLSEDISKINENTILLKKRDYINSKSLIDEIDNIDFSGIVSNLLGNFDFVAKTILNFIQDVESGVVFRQNKFIQDLESQLNFFSGTEAEIFIQKLMCQNFNDFHIRVKNLKDEIKVKDFDIEKSYFKQVVGKLKKLNTQILKAQGAYEKESNKRSVSTEFNKFLKAQATYDSLAKRLKSRKADLNKDMLYCAKFMEIDLVELKTRSGVVDVQESLRLEINNRALLDDIDNSILNSSSYVESFEDQLSKLEDEIALKRALLSLEEEKNETIYSEDERKKLLLIERNFRFIINNLQGFDAVIRNIESNSFDDDLNEFDIEFVKLAGRLIAFSMDNKILRPDGEYVNFDYYDMFKKEFHCDNDRIIRKEDISTGLASANYLKQRIENVEGKYVIVLLDEIGNMAQNTLEEVITSIKKIENEGRLTMAILTQPSSSGIEIKTY